MGALNPRGFERPYRARFIGRDFSERCPRLAYAAPLGLKKWGGGGQALSSGAAGDRHFRAQFFCHYTRTAVIASYAPYKFGLSAWFHCDAKSESAAGQKTVCYKRLPRFLNGSSIGA